MNVERDDHFVRRLESFSDIVIGFSLAEIVLGLAIPAHAVTLVTHPAWFIYYLFTFALVALFWWTHYRLYRTIFFPDTLNVVLNYAWLATVGLLVYFMQVWSHAHTPNDAIVVSRLYYLTLSANFGVSAILVARSYRVRSSALERIGRWRTLGALWGSLGACVLLIAALLLTMNVGPNAIWLVSLAIPAGFAAGRLISRPFIERYVE